MICLIKINPTNLIYVNDVGLDSLIWRSGYRKFILTTDAP